MNRRRFLTATSAGVGTLALAANRLFATQGSLTTEIVVGGAGAFGGWTALYLREQGFTVTLIDQRHHAWRLRGQSRRRPGQAAGTGSDLQIERWLILNHG